MLRRLMLPVLLTMLTAGLIGHAVEQAADTMPSISTTGLLDAAERKYQPLETAKRTPLPSSEADRLLDDLGRQCFEWFQRYRHPVTGLVLDRAPNRLDSAPSPSRPAMCSIASVGYYLGLIPEWVRLGYLSREEAVLDARRTLTFVASKVEHERGLCYHFVSWNTGRRWRRCEASTLDTAILLNGAMVCASFDDSLSGVAQALLDRVEWDAFVVKREDGGQLLSLGWSPEQGLLHPADIRSSEMALAIFVAVGSKHAISPECWYGTQIDLHQTHGLNVLNIQHPLFTSYYGLGWHSLKGKVDRDGIDLFENAREAALLNRDLCRRKGAAYATYALENGGWWGISSGDSPTGYVAPSPLGDDADGMVWPMTALAALPWIPDQLKADLVLWRASPLWDRVKGPFGLRPFRLDDEEPKREFFADQLIGIDQGAFAVSLANYRAETVWKLWEQHPIARRAYDRLGFKSKP